MKKEKETEVSENDEKKVLDVVLELQKILEKQKSLQI